MSISLSTLIRLQNYRNYLILNKTKFKIDDKYFKNKIYIKNSFSYPLLEEEKDKIMVIVKIEKIVNYMDDDQIGEVVVELNNKKIYSENIYVKLDDKKENIFMKIIKAIFN